MKLDTELLKAKVFHGLKSLTLEGDTLSPRYLEIVACQAFGLSHTGDGNFFADGVGGKIQASVKTRKLNPDIKKRVKSKDFQSDPEKFLGYVFNKKQGLIWAGPEIVQRRQAFPDDQTPSPKLLGELTIDGFRANINESKKKFKTEDVYEIIVIHGYSKNQNAYILSLFWQEYQEPNLKEIKWVRKGDGIIGLQKQRVNEKLQDVIVCKRYNNSAKRQSTNYVEFKNPTKYNYSAHIKIPLPDPWEFDKEKILAEIYLKEKQNATILFSE